MDRELFIARVAARVRLSAARNDVPPSFSAASDDAPLPSPAVPPRVAEARARAEAAGATAGLPRAAAGSTGAPSGAGETIAQDHDALVERFVARLGDADGEGARVSDRGQAQAAIAALARERGWTSLCCAPSLCWSAMDDLWTPDPRCADFGLSEAHWGVAETGTVVLRHGGEQARGHSLLPPVVGFLLPASRVVRQVGEVLTRLHEATDPLPACVTFVTGPSHSGDIAGVMCRGVHGPAEVRVWVIGDE